MFPSGGNGKTALRREGNTYLQVEKQTPNIMVAFCRRKTRNGENTGTTSRKEHGGAITAFGMKTVNDTSG